MQLLDEMQVRVRVEDVDDNSPAFSLPLPGRNLSAGVRVNAPVLSRVTAVRASDPDQGGKQPVHYQIQNLTYYRNRRVCIIIIK